MNRSFTRFAILGGDGVFGIHMAKHLLEICDTSRVICVGRNQRKPLHYSLGIGEGDPRFSYVQAHLVHEPDILLRILDEEMPECIINFAALAYATSWNDSFRYYDTNVVALARLTEAIRSRSYFKHWMQIGSSEVYGTSLDGACKEDGSVNPSSPYAVSKLAGDLHLKTYAEAGFPTNVIRPSNAYGPGQQLYRLIPKAAFCALTGRRFPLEGGGVAQKSWLHASDLASAIDHIIKFAPSGEIYNAGPLEATSIRRIVELVAQECGIAFDDLIETAPARLAEDQLYLLDTTKIRDQLGWAPSVNLEDGVREVVQWVRDNLEVLHREPRQYSLRS